MYDIQQQCIPCALRYNMIYTLCFTLQYESFNDAGVRISTTEKDEGVLNLE
jgi:hypothetical protein